VSVVALGSVMHASDGTSLNQAPESPPEKLLCRRDEPADHVRSKGPGCNR
jgi:hypothetical protein